MASTQLARTGSQEQILRVMAALAGSAAYTTELQGLVANLNPALILGPFLDANFAQFTLSATDTQFGGPALWLGQTNSQALPGFAKIWITDQLRIPGGPFPQLQLVAVPGQRGSWNERHSKEWIFALDAIAICVGSFPEAVQREALVMIDAFEQLVYRNQNLGGLVELIDSPTGPMPSGAINHKAGTVAGALVRFEIRIIRISGLS